MARLMPRSTLWQSPLLDDVFRALLVAGVELDPLARPGCAVPPDRLEDLRKLRNDCAKAGTFTGTNTPITPKDQRAWWNDHGRHYAAIVLAWPHESLHPAAAVLVGEPPAHFVTVFVRDAWRGSGLATALMSLSVLAHPDIQVRSLSLKTQIAPIGTRTGFYSPKFWRPMVGSEFLQACAHAKADPSLVVGFKGKRVS